MDQIDSKRESRHRRSVGLNLAAELYELVQRAAAARDLSMAAYCRRAVASFVAHDLGLAYADVMADDRGTRGYAEQGIGGEALAGGGHGDWEIGSLR